MHPIGVPSQTTELSAVPENVPENVSALMTRRADLMAQVADIDAQMRAISDICAKWTEICRLPVDRTGY